MKESGITLIGILTGIYSGNKIAVYLTDTMLAWGVSATYASALAQGVIVVVVTYLTIIFGELVPKRIGLSVAEKAAKLVSRPMNVLSIVASPFVWLLSKSTSAMFNLLGIKDTDSKVTEEEIKTHTVHFVPLLSLLPESFQYPARQCRFYES